MAVCYALLIFDIHDYGKGELDRTFGRIDDRFTYRQVILFVVILCPI
jgi:hypothetical protein